MNRRITVSVFLLGCLIAVLLTLPAAASPFGWGKFGEDVPFGASTSLSVDLGSNVSLSLSPNGANFSGNGSHVVTVTTTDVVGYALYVHATSSTNMTNGSATIAASGNSSPAPLAVNTWGFNTTGSTTDFIGMLTSNTRIKDTTGPYKNGDPTTVTYGALVDAVQPAGTYSAAVTYTVVAKNQ